MLQVANVSSSRRAILAAIVAAGSLALARRGLALDTPVATPTPEVFITHPAYAYDFRDKRVLVGFADTVFLGEVVEQVGSRGLPTSDPEDEIPQTQFTVKVIERIKGDPPDKIVVSQGSGIEKASGSLVLLDGDPLLKPGEVVLFAANRSPDFDWYTIVAGPYGAIRTKDAEDAETMVSEFRAAAVDAFVPASTPGIEESDDEGKRKPAEKKRR